MLRSKLKVLRELFTQVEAFVLVILWWRNSQIGLIRDTVDGSESPANHLGCIKTYKHPVNNGIDYLTTGAGILPSIVSLHYVGNI